MRWWLGVFCCIFLCGRESICTDFLSAVPGFSILFHVKGSAIEKDLSALTPEAFTSLHSISDHFDLIPKHLELNDDRQPLGDMFITQLTAIQSRLDALIFASLPQKKARVLSIDGGGSRGVIALTYLIELEKQTGKQVYELFDHVCATSTGSIIATLLTVPGVSFKNKDIEIKAPVDKPMSALQARALFLHLAKVIFGTPNKKSRFSVPILHTRFNVRPFGALLKEILGTKTFSDTLIPVSITSYSLDAHVPVIKSSFHENERTELLRKAVRASTAAPGIFLPTKSGRIDGGLAFNNPSIVAALLTWRYLKRDMSEQLLLSVGNGTDTTPVSRQEIESMYITGIASKVIEILLNGENTNFLTAYLFQIYHAEPEGRSYFRFQCHLPSNLNVIDAIDEVRLNQFIEIAVEDIAKKRGKFAQLLAALGEGPQDVTHPVQVEEVYPPVTRLSLDDFEIFPPLSPAHQEMTRLRHNSE